jgi:hypothetical protein
MALLVLGLAFATKAPRGRVAALVLSVWALYVLGKAGVVAAFALTSKQDACDYVISL